MGKFSYFCSLRLDMKPFFKDRTVGLTRDFQTVGYVHVGSEVFIRADAH
jgi:hypothetical protein